MCPLIFRIFLWRCLGLHILCPPPFRNTGGTLPLESRTGPFIECPRHQKRISLIGSMRRRNPTGSSTKAKSPRQTWCPHHGFRWCPLDDFSEVAVTWFFVVPTRWCPLIIFAIFEFWMFCVFQCSFLIMKCNAFWPTRKSLKTTSGHHLVGTTWDHVTSTN